jgi:hypothetical protein
MILYALIPLAWGSVTAFVVATCRAASRADAGGEQAELEPGDLVR